MDSTKPTAPEAPALITSGEGAYWQVGMWTESPGAAAEMIVDRMSVHQPFEGFGGAFNEAGWDALLQLDAAERERALQLLFGQDGLRIVWGRLPIGASEYALDRYTLDDTDNDLAMEHFSIERDRERLLPYVKAALAINPDLRLWATPWTPPLWMKNRATADNGSIRDEPDVLSAYALYLARYVEAYAEEGLQIVALHPQNEPTLAQDQYPACTWSRKMYATFIADYLGPTFEQRALTTEIWLGSLGVPDDDSFAQAVLEDAGAARWISGIGAGWDADTVPASLLPGYQGRIFHTLHSPGNRPWLAEFRQVPPNDHEYALYSWQLMYDWISRGVQTYSAWNMVLDTTGVGLDTTWPKNAPLVVDRSAGSLIVTPAYYVFRHLSQFIQPGAFRIELSSDRGLAFENPDDSVVVVVHNPDATPESASLAIDDTVLQFDVPARGWATVNWQP